MLFQKPINCPIVYDVQRTLNSLYEHYVSEISRTLSLHRKVPRRKVAKAKVEISRHRGLLFGSGSEEARCGAKGTHE